MKKIFIAGVPATGKTTIGNYLAEKFDFIHFDVESDLVSQTFARELFWNLEIDKFIEQINGVDKNIVITWGFVCDHKHSLDIINMLQIKGFKFIWFHAEESVARTKFLERGTGDIRAFDIQMERIKNLNLEIFINPVIITTLDNNGRKNKEEIAKEMLSL